MAEATHPDPLVSTEEVTVDAEMLAAIERGILAADEDVLFPTKRFGSLFPSGFPSFYTEPALADLQEVMHWSWQNHPGTSERFANALLNHVDLLKDFPNLGEPVRGCPGVRRLRHSPLHVYYRVVLESRRVEFSTSGIAPGATRLCN
jgi:plasmid stabilization system protein ParE